MNEAEKVLCDEAEETLKGREEFSKLFSDLAVIQKKFDDIVYDIFDRDFVLEDVSDNLRGDCDAIFEAIKERVSLEGEDVIDCFKVRSEDYEYKVGKIFVDYENIIYEEVEALKVAVEEAKKKLALAKKKGVEEDIDKADSDLDDVTWSSDVEEGYDKAKSDIEDLIVNCIDAFKCSSTVYYY